MIKRLYTLSFFFIVLGLMSCAGSGQLANNGNTRTYNKNIQIINNYFLQIIKNSSKLLAEDAVDKSKGKLYIISNRVGLNSSTAQSDNSIKVYINSVNKNKTTVEIETPDYPFGYPQYKKVNYQRIIFSQLEKMLNQK